MLTLRTDLAMTIWGRSRTSCANWLHMLRSDLIDGVSDTLSLSLKYSFSPPPHGHICQLIPFYGSGDPMYVELVYNAVNEMHP